MFPNGMLNVEDMILFSQLVRAGGFARAASQLGVPKSTLSRRIARLETQLGSRLVERNTRTMRLTDVGESILRHCDNVANEVALARGVAERSGDGPSGVLSVNVCYSLGWQLLDPVVTEFLQMYPGVKVRLIMSNHRVDLIAEGFDLAIRAGELYESDLIAKKIGSSKVAFFASPSYLHAFTRPLVTPADLASARLLHMSAHELPSRLALIGPRGVESFDFDFSAVVNDFQLLKQLIVSGAGIAVIPEYLCVADVAAGRLVQVLPDWALRDLEFQAVYPSRQGVTPKLRAFLRLLEARLSLVLSRSSHVVRGARTLPPAQGCESLPLGRQERAGGP